MKAYRIIKYKYEKYKYLFDLEDKIIISKTINIKDGEIFKESFVDIHSKEYKYNRSDICIVEFINVMHVSEYSEDNPYPILTWGKEILTIYPGKYCLSRYSIEDIDNLIEKMEIAKQFAFMDSLKIS